MLLRGDVASSIPGKKNQETSLTKVHDIAVPKMYAFRRGKKGCFAELGDVVIDEARYLLPKAVDVATRRHLEGMIEVEFRQFSRTF